MLASKIEVNAMSRLSLVIVSAVAWFSLFANAPLAVLAAENSPSPATQIWLISTRSAPGCGDLEAGLSQIAYWRLDESCNCGTWQTSDAGAFQASALPGVPTTVFIHGYGTDHDWAVRHGNQLYGLMKQQACGHAFRLIVWSWPADHMGRYRADVQAKICRSDVEAYYLARVLCGLPKGTPLSMEGYSLGCRTASGALELWAGGSVAGHSLAPEILAAWQNAGPRPMRVIMLAPAMDTDWLEPCCPGGLAPLAVQRILVVTDGCDRAMKWYSRIYGRHGPEAMGHAGPAGTAGGKLEVVDVCCEVGKKHAFDLYQDSSPVTQRLAWYTFLCDAPATTAAKVEKSDVAADNRPAR